MVSQNDTGASELLERTRGAEPPCVSVYMPTHRALPETQQDPTRFKNLMRSARAKCEEFGVGKRVIANLLDRADSLQKDEFFWEHQDLGLAVLVGPNTELVVPLPYECEELALVSDRFFLRPLLRVAEEPRFFVLAVSGNGARLYEGTQFGSRAVEVPDLPQGMADVLGVPDPEESLQLHTLSSRRGADSDVVFHGQGGGQDQDKADLVRYLRAVDQAVCAHARTSGVRPLVLACVDHYLPVYREVSDYADLVDTIVSGSPEASSEPELRERAWQTLAPRRARVRRAVDERFSATAGSDTPLRDVVLAAQNSRIAEVLIADDVMRWGRPSPDGVADPEVHRACEPGDVELLDFVAVETLKAGGAVHFRPSDAIPNRRSAVALLRY